MHAYSIVQIVEWFREGMTWYVLSITPLRNLATVPEQPWSWWFLFYSYGDWYSNSDDNWHPYPYLGWLILIGVFRLISKYIDESATTLISSAIAIIMALIGALPGWAGNVAHGLGVLLQRIGSGILMWATDAIQAAQWLYNRLPIEISVAGLSWSTYLEFAKASVKSWVVSIYDSARNYANSLHDWYIATGQYLSAWITANRNRIDDLLSSFNAKVAAALGDDWRWLIVFKSGAGAWLSSFKALYADQVAELFADPGGWIMKKIIAEIERIW